MKYRVIEEKSIFYVEKKTGFIFKSWVKLNQYGLPLDYNHDWEDADPKRFTNLKDAINFMEKSTYPPKKVNKTPVIKAWI